MQTDIELKRGGSDTMKRRWGVQAIVMGVLVSMMAACGSGLPQVTPTFVPTHTTTATLEPTAIADLPSRTPVPTFTMTAAPSATPTDTPTATTTPTPSQTPTGTFTPRPTATATQTPTMTPSPTASHTPIPPTATPTKAPSVTPLPTIGASDTPTPSPTPTITPSHTATPTLTFTPAPTNTPTIAPLPTFTPTSTLSPAQATAAVLRLTLAAIPTPTFGVQTPSPAPTLDVTPTFITATAPADLGIITVSPVVGTDTPVPVTPTPTDIPPTVNPQFVPERAVFIPPPQLPPPPSFSTTQALVFSVNGASVAAAAVETGGAAAFVRYNPADANSYIRVDPRGMLYLRPPGGGAEGAYTDAPYFAGFNVPDANSNKNRIIAAEWSPNGQQFAFIIASTNDPTNNGLWFWQPARDLPTDPSYQLIRDCDTCGFVVPNPILGAMPTRSKTLEWNGDNFNILVQMELPGEGRRGIAVVKAVRDAYYANTGPAVYRYDYGTWAQDQQRIVVSGRRPDGRVIMGFISCPDYTFQTAACDPWQETVVLDGSAAGLWLQNAVQRPNGQLVALGRPGDPNGAMAIYDQNGQRLTDFIGTAPPTEVQWSCERSAVTVLAGGRRYVATVNGSVREVPSAAGGFSCGRLPDMSQPLNADGTSAPPVPSGVVEGNAFAPGQQLRIINSALNVRTAPNANEPNVVSVLNFGDFVRVIAGPYPDPNGRYEWWEVATAQGITGWIAAVIDGRFTVEVVE